jgi:hypothetical protein
MSLWEERAARNEALFREVNEQVDSLAERQGGGADEERLFICECSDDRCAERVAVPKAVYEEVRANPRRFLVVPGHDRDFEHVVERAERYAIVEKEGRAGEVAEQTDPRE